MTKLTASDGAKDHLPAVEERTFSAARCWRISGWLILGLCAAYLLLPICANYDLLVVMPGLFIGTAPAALFGLYFLRLRVQIDSKGIWKRSLDTET